jgi:soluble P-type ATPase
VSEPVLEVEVPGWRRLRLECLLLDVNGTLTQDGVLLAGVEPRLASLRGQLRVVLLSADTFGRLDAVAARLQVQRVRLQPGQPEAPQKARVVDEFGSQAVVAIGNGANDAQMLQSAALGIAVLGPEGLAVPAMLNADVLVGSIQDALDLLLNPKRLVASLRR